MTEKIESSYEKTKYGKIDIINDWSSWLGSGGETINTSSWEADSELTLTGDTNDTTTATVFVAGGVLKKTYKVINKITTTPSGRQASRTTLITVVPNT